MFAGWAESELWHDGPIPYEAARLDASLVTRLQEWANEHYRAYAEQGDSPTGTRDRLAHHGVALAQEVAQQLGDGFIVEVDDPTHPGRLRLRGDGRPASPEAAAALRARAINARARQEQLRKSAQDRTYYWTASSSTAGPAGADDGAEARPE
ncbi:hypothetical protein DT076_07075 [Desertihabitans brevis]|uniref:Uncharacterized protein n=1 Tax=Desertihabitans brevis TaxID=2268447 RepID=A0A367YWX7_9ACTN|nr:hypothetical protein DT076_07075 [Desertihabitans brevis]